MSRLACVLALGACATTAGQTPVPWAAAGIDWNTPPVVERSSSFVPPAIDRIELGNGVRVLVITNDRLPIVAVNVLELAAGSRDDGTLHGIAGLTAELLDKGAGTRDRTQLADELERLGARLELDIASDDASAHVTALRDHFAETMDLLGDVIRRPRFDAAEVARVRGLRVAELTERAGRPRTMAAQLFDHVVFGAHPYGHPAEGTPRSVAALTADDVRGFHARAYGPATTIIIVAGDVRRAQVEQAVTHAFGDWRGGAAVSPPPPIAPYVPELAYIDIPGATQTAVMIGRRIPVDVVGDAAAEVGNGVLGGSTDARLDRALRDRLAASTGAGSSFWSGAWSRTWAISTSVRTERTADAIHAALALVDELRSTPAPQPELARAQQTLVRAFTRSFETATSTTRALEHLVVRGVPPETAIARLLADVTPASAHDAISPLWTDLAIVVVGDWATIGPQLRALGLPTRAYDTEGELLP